MEQENDEFARRFVVITSMEKPGASYPSSYARNDRESAAVAYALKHYERVVPKTVTRLSDRPQEDGKPVWRGDHSFSSDAAAYALTNFIEPEITKKHPDWTKKKVAEAAQEQFVRRLSQDLSYEHKERSHDETVVRWQPIQTEDGSVELATEYGGAMVTLKELWDHTREYAEFVGNPAAYNREEERAQLAMQDEFLHGSSSAFVSILSHPDSIRYMQVWEKTDDGNITSRQVDLYKTTGRDFSYEEGNNLVRHIEQYYKGTGDGKPQEEASAYAHFFTSHIRLDEHEMRMLAVAASMRQTQGKESDGRQEGHFEGIAISRATDAESNVRRGQDTLMLVGAYLREHLLKTGDRKPEGKTVVPARKSGKRTVSHETQKHTAKRETSVTAFSKKNLHIPKETPSVDTAEIPFGMRENGALDKLPGMTAVRRMMTEWYVSMRHMANAREIPSGGIVVIQMMSRERSGNAGVSKEQKTRTETAVSREKPTARLVVSRMRRTVAGFAAFVRRITLGSATVPKDTVMSSEKSQHAAREMLPRLYRSLTIRTKRMAEHAASGLLHISGYVARAIRTVTERVRRTGKIPERDVKHPGIRGAAKGQAEMTGMSLSGAEGISDVEIAITVWFLMLGGGAFAGERTTLPASSQNNLRGNMPKEHPGNKPSEEDASAAPVFVLLAIIRYLSLLRESGKATAVKATGSSARRRVRQITVWRDTYAAIPGRRRIIFTFAS